MGFLFLNYDPSRVSVECSNCLPSPSKLNPKLLLSSIRQLLTSLLSSFRFPAVAFHCVPWIFTQHMCTSGVSQGFQSLYANMGASPYLLHIYSPLMEFSLVCFQLFWEPWTLTLTFKPSMTAPFAWVYPPWSWAQGSGPINVDLNKCVFFLSRYECSPAPACFWSLFSAFQWLVLYFVQIL